MSTKALQLPPGYGDNGPRTVALLAQEIRKSDGYYTLGVQCVGVDTIGHVTNLTETPYDKLIISCQGNTDGRDPMPYGYSVTYRDVYSVNERNAEEMLAMLRKINKGLDKIGDTEGAFLSFGQYACRVARVLGIAHMVRVEPGNGWAYGYGSLSSLRDAQFHFDTVIREASQVAVA